MARFTLDVLGGFRARAGRRALKLSKKSRALLTYLALSAPESHPRARLAGLLWGDRGEEHARNSLRQSLFEVRKAMGAMGERLLEVDHDMVRLRVESIAIDAVEFSRLAASGASASTARAAALYRGDLLADLDVKERGFETWLVAQRERFHALGLRVLNAHLANLSGRKALDEGVETAHRLLALDSLQEPVHRALMRLYTTQGRHAAALRQYELCVSILRRELRIEPDRQTQELYREIVAARTPRSSSRPGRRDAAQNGARAPFVGRGAEIARLRSALRDARAGRGCVVAILGEAGIGKSRLVEEILRDVMAGAFRRIEGRAHRSEQILPFGLWVGTLRDSGIVSDRSVAADLGAPWKQELTRLFPELGVRFGPKRAGVDDHLRLFEAVAELLRAAARHQPLMTILEDVHWADPTSLRLIAFLARRLAAEPICLLVTARVEELDDAAPLRSILSELARHPGFVELPLGPLARGDIRALTRALAGRAVSPAVELEERVWRASEGNPLVVVETMRAFHERGKELANVTLPEGVRRIVRERFDRLDDSARELLGIAAVYGREFDPTVVQDVAEVDARTLARAVEAWIARRIVQPRGERLDFTHDRLRDVAYDDVVEPRRRMLHLVVAETIERRHATDLSPHRAVLASHYRDAHMWEKATVHLRATADQAAERGAYRDAIALFERVLCDLDRVPSSVTALEQGVDIRLEMRDLAVTLGDMSRVFEHLDDAERLARQLGDERRVANVLLRISHSHFLVGDQCRTIELATQVRATGEALEDAVLTGHSLFRLCQAFTVLGDYPRALEHGRHAEHVLTGQRNPSRSLGVPRAINATWIGAALCQTGDFEEALATVERAKAIAEADRQPYSIFYTTYVLGRILLERGDLAHALPLLEDSYAKVEEWNIGLMRAGAAHALAYASALAGHHARAIELAAVACPERASAAVNAAFRAETMLAVGRLEEALAHARHAVALAERFGERGHEAMARCVLADAEACRSGESHRAALVSYREALAVAEKLGMRPVMGRCRLGLSRVSRDGTANEHRVRAQTMFRELDMPYWIDQAKG